MSLWIRGQDKEQLLQVERLFLRDKMICTNIREALGWTPLGEYNTKERALEVLDEINDIKFYKYMASLNYQAFMQMITEKYSLKEQAKLISMMNTYIMPEK